MADIFLGYSHEDKQVASWLAGRLGQEGWSVFWDVQIPPGESWREFLERKVSEACCVVVLWSQSSIASHWVKAEAEFAIERRVLIPALLHEVKPPFGLGTIQASNLEGWDGNSDTKGLAALVRAITKICPPSKRVKMWPSDVAVVIGRRKTHGEMGATFNLMCHFFNELDRTATLKRIEATVTGPGDWSHDFLWQVLYDTVNATEHVRRVDRSASIEIPAQSTFEIGVQFRAPMVSGVVSWPDGKYRFEVWGWGDRNRGDHVANVRTDFDVEISDEAAWQIKRLLEAPDDWWASMEEKISNDAIGIPVSIVGAGARPRAV